jgi:hypothetical protein
LTIKLSEDKQNILDSASKLIMDRYDNIFEELNSVIKNNDGCSTLYHYTNVSALKSILEKESLWLTYAKYLNDSSELKYTIEIINNLREQTYHLSMEPKARGYEWLKKKEYFDKKLDLCVSKMKDKLNDVFVLSTSINSDSLVLWSYYSNNEGYNIGFDKNLLTTYLGSLQSKKTDTRFELYADKSFLMNKSGNRFSNREVYTVLSNTVIYDQEYQKNSIISYLEIICQLCNEFYNKQGNKIESEYYTNVDQYIDSIIESMASQLSILSIFFKNPCFMPEEEFRITFILLEEVEFSDSRLLKWLLAVPPVGIPTYRTALERSQSIPAH